MVFAPHSLRAAASSSHPLDLQASAGWGTVGGGGKAGAARRPAGGKPAAKGKAGGGGGFAAFADSDSD